MIGRKLKNDWREKNSVSIYHYDNGAKIFCLVITLRYTGYYYPVYFLHTYFLHTLVMEGSKAPRVSTKRWVFTLNNPTVDEILALQGDEGAVFSYLLFGREHMAVSAQDAKNGKTVGTPHLQGYFELPKRRGPRGLAESLPGLTRARLAVAKGTQKQNHTYCGKEDKDPFEYGKPQAQGQRTDLLSIKTMIDEGAIEAALWQSSFVPMLRYHKAFAAYRASLHSEPRDFKCSVILIVGPTGTGKSFLVRLLLKSGAFGTYYVARHAKGSGLYFDGYQGQDTIFFDEFDGNRCTPTFLNELCDEGEFWIPQHCAANINCRVSTVIICTNYHPRYWWRRGVNVAPFMRRVSLSFFSGYRGGFIASPEELRRMERVRGKRRKLHPVILVGSRAAWDAQHANVDPESDPKGKEEAD